MPERPTPNIHLIIPPLTGEDTCIILEDGQRQTWRKLNVTEHELDYINLADIWPGQLTWSHDGRHLNEASFRWLTFRMGSGHGEQHATY